MTYNLNFQLNINQTSNWFSFLKKWRVSTRRPAWFSISSPEPSSTEKSKILQNQGLKWKSRQAYHTGRQNRHHFNESLLSAQWMHYFLQQFSFWCPFSSFQKCKRNYRSQTTPSYASLSWFPQPRWRTSRNYKKTDIYLRTTAVIFYRLGWCTPLPDIMNPDKRESEIIQIKNCSLNSYNLYHSQ